MTLGLKDLYYAVCTEADGAESYGYISTAHAMLFMQSTLRFKTKHFAKHVIHSALCFSAT